jgi:hypothetical protein
MRFLVQGQGNRVSQAVQRFLSSKLEPRQILLESVVFKIFLPHTS